jgi:hypothetical protein
MNSDPHLAPSPTFYRFACCLVFFIAAIAHDAWAQPPAAINATLKKMLAATESRSRDAFIAQGDASFQADITPAKFNEFSAELAPRLKQGYTTTFETKSQQKGYAVYVWKLEFKDGGDDWHISIAVKDGKVGGFALQ